MTDQQVSAPLGAVLGGRYQLVSSIGVGVSSRVYLAVDTQLRRRVAVKVLHEALAEDKEFLTRFRAEARAAAALSHPNILAVFDWGEDQLNGTTVPYLVTEFLGGGSLRTMLDTGTCLSPSQSLMVGLDVSRALHHANDRGLVHRDVKPANLLFDTDGRLRLADFGLARALAEASWTEPTGATAGTTRYASPEQAMGQRLDGKSDVYSLALVLMEAAQGEVPLLADTAAGTMAMRMQQTVVVPTEYGALRGPLLRATASTPEDRCDASEFEIALLAAAEHMPRPEPLDVVSSAGQGDETTELHLNDAMAGLVMLGALSDDNDADASAEHTEYGSDVVFADPDSEEGAETATERGSESKSADSAAGQPMSVRKPLVPLDASAESRSEAKPKRRWVKWLLIALAIVVAASAGAGWWFLIRVPSYEVPNWIGEDVAVANAEAEEFGWTTEDARVIRADDTVPGEVTEQTPSAGNDLAEGESVRLTVSLGPTLTPFPVVVGTTEADATAAITDAGLVVGEVTSNFDEEVKQGLVVAGPLANPILAVDENGEVPKESVVDLVISRGPAPRQIPGGLVGVPVAEATAALTAVQLKADVNNEYSETIAKGLVISSGLESGSEVPRGSSVPLVVSDGPAPIAIPNVAGQSGSAAAANLEAAGLVVSGIEGSPSGTVLATDPPAGELHQRGTSVRIFTRQ